MVKIQDIPLVILAGGRGTRISEYSKIIPKPMIKIGGIPIIQHIIDYYKSFGVNNFIIASGYKSYIFKKYFINKKNITVISTGLKSLTGGRIKRLEKKISTKFFLTYGDGLSNVNIYNLLKSHEKSCKTATVTAVHPIARFGEIKLNKKNLPISFNEKPQVKSDWINGGFFIFEQSIFKYLKNDNTILETTPMQKLIDNRKLNVFKHHGFWQCMDTVRDKEVLDQIYKSKSCPWTIK
tara:strand:+ start:114 stop:824 length:711 start_codon:yes stop_codon:yes gene_type:complete